MEAAPQQLLLIEYISIRNLRRKYLGVNSNVELYSLNKSLLNNILWKFQVQINGINIEGSVQKLHQLKPVKFSHQEMVKAIHGTFLGSHRHSINRIPRMALKSSWQSSHIAFTMGADQHNPDEIERLKKYVNCKVNCHTASFGAYTIETGKLKPLSKTNITNVYGLLRVTQPVVSLESYVCILEEHFPKDLITWMNICTNPVRFGKVYELKPPLPVECRPKSSDQADISKFSSEKFDLDPGATNQPQPKRVEKGPTRRKSPDGKNADFELQPQLFVEFKAIPQPFYKPDFSQFSSKKFDSDEDDIFVIHTGDYDRDLDCIYGTIKGIKDLLDLLRGDYESYIKKVFLEDQFEIEYINRPEESPTDLAFFVIPKSKEPDPTSFDKKPEGGEKFQCLHKENVQLKNGRMAMIGNIKARDPEDFISQEFLMAYLRDRFGDDFEIEIPNGPDKYFKASKLSTSAVDATTKDLAAMKLGGAESKTKEL